MRAVADGYTLLLIGPNNAISATLYDKLNEVGIILAQALGGRKPNPGAPVAGSFSEPITAQYPDRVPSPSTLSVSLIVHLGFVEILQKS